MFLQRKIIFLTSLMKSFLLVTSSKSTLTTRNPAGGYMILDLEYQQFFFFAGLYSLEYSARASNMPASTHSYTHLTSLCRHCDLWFNDDLRLFSYIDWALLASWLVFHCTYSWINSMMVWIISFVSFSDCCIHMTKIYAEDILTSKQGAHPFYMQHKERHG